MVKNLLFFSAIIAVLSFFGVGNDAMAQCPLPNNNFAHFANPNMTPSGVGDTITSNSVWGGDYTIIDVDSGDTYWVSLCQTPYFADTGYYLGAPGIYYDPQITLYRDTAAPGAFGIQSNEIVGHNDDFCGVLPELIYTATFTGRLAVSVDPINCDSFAVDSAILQISEILLGISGTITPTNLMCNGGGGGSASVGVTNNIGPISYLWSTGGTTNTISGLAAGTYSVIVSDTAGNADTAYTSLTEPTAVVASASVTTPINCFGESNGQLTATATGGTGSYTYAWSNGQVAAVATNVPVGTYPYEITITDQNGCTDSSSVAVTQPSILVSSSSVTTAINCTGSTDGQVTGAATGGTMPYTFSWNTGGTAALETGLGAGTYSVTITDQNGCTDSSSTVVAAPNAVVATATTTANVSSFGLSDGATSASASGGSSPYSYVWSTPAAGSNLAAQSFENNANDTWSFVADPVTYNTEGDSIVDGSDDVWAVIQEFTNDIDTATNGLYFWGAQDLNNPNGGNTAYHTLTFSPVDVSTNTGVTLSFDYYSKGYDTSDSLEYQVYFDNGTTWSNNGTPLAKNSLAWTSVSINVPDSANFVRFRWQAKQDGSSDFSGLDNLSLSSAGNPTVLTSLAAGTYTVTVTDQNGCTNNASTTVTQPALLVASSVADSNTSCNGSADAGATASATGGTMPYTYAWSNSATTASITGVAAGTYSVTITDASGATDSSSVSLTQPILLVAAGVIDSNTSCNGFADGGATASATGGTGVYTYSWSNSATTASITGVVASTYSVTVTDQNGCTDSTSVIMTEPANLVASTVLDSNDLGNGGGATASATGGTSAYTYTWSNGATTASVTGISAGTYSTTITDQNGCTDSASISITAGPTLSITTDSNVTCNGYSNGGATAVASSGSLPYTYSWSNSATTASITGVVAGTYSVTVSDINGITANSSVTITEPIVLVAASVVDSNTTCNGVSDGGASASATGGTMPYTYSWSNAATTASITGVLAGTYTATITDANGCSSTSAATVTQPTILASTIVLDSNTVDGNPNGGASASANGGTMPYTYSWSNAATTASITGVMAGTYSATITDQNGCTDSSSVVIINTLSLTASTVLDSNVSCNGLNDGGATAVPNGTGSPFSYAWSNAATTASITGVAAGTYTVTITDVNSSTATASVTITQPVVLIASSVVDSNVVCFGQANGGASASATGGTTPYAYAWSNAATTASITGIIADTFMVIITDANGCTSTSSVTIVEPPMMTLNIGNDTAVCLNANLVLDAGSGYSSYLWSDNAATQTTVANTAASGSMDYSVTVTNVNGCEAIDTLNVTVNNPAALSIASIADLCAYGSDSLIATLGFTDYLWNTSDTVNSIFVDGLVLGQGSYSYSVTATDTNGCVANASTSFDVYNEVTVNLGPDVTVQWIDGVVESYTLDAGTGYSSYSWNNGNGTNQTYVVTLLNMGHVYLDVTDATGCIGKDTVFVDFILSTPTIEIGQVKVYPNPAYDVLNIEVSNFINAGELDIKIMSITGATVLSSSYTANSGAVKEAIDISKLNPGTYFIEFYANGQKTMKSFIVR